MDNETYEKMIEALIDIRVKKNTENWGKSEISKLNNPVSVRDSTGIVKHNNHF